MEILYFQAFLDTLDAPMIKQLALCCLQRGAGSMDFVHSLMITMYDNDEELVPESQHQDAFEEPTSHTLDRQQTGTFTRVVQVW